MSTITKTVKKNRTRYTVATELIPELESWLRRCNFWSGKVTVKTDFPNKAVGFAIEIGSTATAMVQAQGFPTLWGDFPVRFWNEKHDDVRKERS